MYVCTYVRTYVPANLIRTIMSLDWAKFEANEKDLESDGALWDLYERWCKVFNQERDREEMARRFSYFKKTVLRVEQNKKSDLPYRLGINHFADGKLRELCIESGSMNFRQRRSCSTSLSYGSEVRGQARRKRASRRNRNLKSICN